MGKMGHGHRERRVFFQLQAWYKGTLNTAQLKYKEKGGRGGERKSEEMREGKYAPPPHY